MIKTIKNKKIKSFVDGDKSKVDQRHLKHIDVVLAALDSAEELDDLNLPGKDFHQLKQFDPVRWSLRVSGNWRITFEWDGSHVYDVDYLDPH